MSDPTGSDTPDDPHADAVAASLRESIDQLLDMLDAADADPEQLAELADAKETLTTAASTHESDAGPSLAERVATLEADIEDRTIQKTVIRHVLAAHGLSDDHVDRLLTDMEAVSEQLRADDE
jgi:transposase